MKLNLIAILYFLFTGLWLMQPMRTGNSQGRDSVIPISTLKEKSQQLDEQHDQTKEEVLSVVSNAIPDQKPKPKVIYRTRRIKVIKEVLASDQKILLRVNNRLIYETDPELYKGNVIVDVDLDSLNNDWLDEINLQSLSIPPVDTSVWFQPDTNQTKHKTPGRFKRILQSITKHF